MGFIEHHRHLDASIRATTLAELVCSNKIEGPYQTVEQVQKNFWITRQLGSLRDVLARFVLFQKCMNSIEVLKRVGKEAVQDAIKEGITKLELRYSPSFTSELSKIPWKQALLAFKEGIEEGSLGHDIRTGLICIVSRDFGVDMAHQTVDFAVENKDAFVAVDLAGNEENFPCKMFVDSFRKASNAGIPVTIHAGEGAGAENIWEAIDLLGARRIGHGIRAIGDVELMHRLAKDKILLETCPTSNFITRTISDFQSHPLPRFLHAGIPVSINTDDPGIFGVTLGEEYERCRKILGLNDGELKKINEYADQYSFIK